MTDEESALMDDEDDGEGDGGWGLAVGPFRDGRVHVVLDKCSTCIFRPGNLMRLEPGRVRQMVRDSVVNQSCIPCHSTLVTGLPAVCRGFWDGYADRVLAFRLAQAMEIVEFVPAPSKEQVWGTARGQTQ